MTSLYCAAWQGHNEIVRVVIEAEADLNIQQKVQF